MQGRAAMAVGKAMEGSRGMCRAARAPMAAQQAEQPRLAAVMVSCWQSIRILISLVHASPGPAELWRQQGLHIQSRLCSYTVLKPDLLLNVGLHSHASRQPFLMQSRLLQATGLCTG